MEKRNELPLSKQTNPQHFLEPTYEALNYVADRIIQSHQTSKPMRFPGDVLWGVYVSFDTDTLIATICSHIEEYYRSRGFPFLLKFVSYSNVGRSSPVGSFLRIGIKIGKNQRDFVLRDVERYLYAPVSSALVEIVEQWLEEKFLRTYLPAAKSRQLTEKEWIREFNNMKQVIDEHISGIRATLSNLRQRLSNEPGVQRAVEEIVEEVFKQFSPGSPEFGEILDGLTEYISHVYERTFGEKVSGREKESIRRELGAKVYTWEEAKILREALRRSGLINLGFFLWNAAKITWKRRQLEGYGVWDLMKRKTKERILSLLERLTLDSKEEEKIMLMIGDYLYAPLRYIDHLATQVNFKQQLGGQTPQIPQVKPQIGPPPPPKVGQPSAPSYSPFGGRRGMIFFIKQIKIKEPKKVKPITKLPSLSDVVYRILLWWKNLSDKDKAVLSSILRRYLTETDDEVRKELERELVSVAKGLGIPVKFKEKQTD